MRWQDGRHVGGKRAWYAETPHPKASLHNVCGALGKERAKVPSENTPLSSLSQTLRGKGKLAHAHMRTAVSPCKISGRFYPRPDFSNRVPMQWSFATHKTVIVYSFIRDNDFESPSPLTCGQMASMNATFIWTPDQLWQPSEGSDHPVATALQTSPFLLSSRGAADWVHRAWTSAETGLSVMTDFAFFS